MPFTTLKKEEMVKMYNYYDIDFNNATLSQLRDLEIELDRGGFDYDKVILLRDVREELHEYFTGETDKDTILENLKNSHLTVEDTREIKQLIEDIHEEVWEYEKGDEIKELNREEVIKQLIEWQSYSKVELEHELRSRNMKVSGTKDELFERLAENL